MHELQTFGIFLIEVDTGYPAVVDLPPKLAEVGAALVPHPCLWYQTAFIACLEYADGEVYVLAKPHSGESAQCSVHLISYSHVERTGVELLQFLLSSSDTSGGKE